MKLILNEMVFEGTPSEISEFILQKKQKEESKLSFFFNQSNTVSHSIINCPDITKNL